MAARYPTAQWLGQTPNNGGKFKAGQPTILVCHYTAGGAGLDSANYLMKSAAEASAPFVIDRDGAVLQISEIDLVNWHAGKSAWKGLTKLNAYSIGLEFANLGYMKKVGGKWMTGASKFQSEYTGTNGVIEAAHKNDPTKIQGWEKYPDVQIVAGLALAEWLLTQFPTIKEVVGHDDISPGRKSDPGPAFPMGRFQALFS